jgi:geranylgeranyl reductase
MGISLKYDHVGVGTELQPPCHQAVPKAIRDRAGDKISGGKIKVEAHPIPEHTAPDVSRDVSLLSVMPLDM